MLPCAACFAMPDLFASFEYTMFLKNYALIIMELRTYADKFAATIVYYISQICLLLHGL
jgi:hypothetical protein